MNKLSGRSRRRGFLLDCLRLVGAASLSLLASRGWARRQTVIVSGVRVSTREGETRIVFDISAPVEHNIFTLHDPERVVIDLSNARFPNGLSQSDVTGSLIRSVRYAPRDKGDLRIVLDLSARAHPSSFLLRPADRFGHRLVVDLHRPQTGDPTPVKSKGVQPPKMRDVVIAIDAGHGGKDSGAIGRRGTKEKQVTLSIARKLAALVKKEHGMRPVMIRNSDLFLPLRTRIKKARQHHADLFISIHADASRNRRAKGSSVYVLSQRGASSEHARWLAKRENAADLIGGVSLDDKDDVLASVLLDLSQTATIEASIELADDLLAELKGVGRVHSLRVEQAGFAVLKSPDIPSVLVETAFISNPAEEKRLLDQSQQQSIARGILRGIRRYFSDHAPPGTVLAGVNRKRHVIQQGETLSIIARRYRVDVSHLRRHNALKSDRVHAGQVLLIPLSDS